MKCIGLKCFQKLYRSLKQTLQSLLGYIWTKRSKVQSYMKLKGNERWQTCAVLQISAHIVFGSALLTCGSWGNIIDRPLGRKSISWHGLWNVPCCLCFLVTYKTTHWIVIYIQFCILNIKTRVNSRTDFFYSTYTFTKIELVLLLNVLIEVLLKPDEIQHTR